MDAESLGYLLGFAFSVWSLIWMILVVSRLGDIARNTRQFTLIMTAVSGVEKWERDPKTYEEIPILPK